MVRRMKSSRADWHQNEKVGGGDWKCLGFWAHYENFGQDQGVRKICSSSNFDTRLLLTPRKLRPGPLSIPGMIQVCD